ncbi:GNAT family N-acetyltransferase [Nocardioides mesophilus]|uniref:GNAT family N-acetyltransferase n=1 Tax=Nocardioides mesophilus TaxID=433659 RepID=A0A7G9RBV2_9ACTN|nr:GNAT family N-acetyltransferase [Nocardioides mesophilus]QNN53077.1 GNAT family N-acetyltransferase [Nocardioides mesophilus]
MPTDPTGPVGADPLEDLVLRPATVSDADELAALFLASREAAFPAMPRPVHPPDEVRAWFGEVLGERPRTLPMPAERETWVAERRDGPGPGRLVGYAVVDPDWLDSLYVHPGLVGQGLGGLLLDLVKSLRPGGFGLWVFETNRPAQAFYRRHGLHVVRRTDGSENEERAPDLEMAWFGTDPVGTVRRRIDEVDDRLAALLDERAALTAAAQRLKPVSGHAGRDRRREAEIVARMSRVAERLGPDRLARIMDAVITESLDAAD